MARGAPPQDARDLAAPSVDHPVGDVWETILFRKRLSTAPNGTQRELLSCGDAGDSWWVPSVGAANGGPAPGSRVVALARGAFAERVVADVGSLAEVPSSVDLAQAAARPAAGVAAPGALRAGGPLLGRRVLITGASGGVGGSPSGWRQSPARVIAVVGSAARGQGMGRGRRRTGRDRSRLDAPVDVVLDSVGKAILDMADT